MNMLDMRVFITTLLILICSLNEPVYSTESLTQKGLQVDKSVAEDPSLFSVPVQCRVHHSPAVFSCRVIPKGEVFSRESLVVKEINSRKIPCDSFHCIEPLLERRARATIQCSTLIDRAHVNQNDLYKWTTNDESFEKRILNQRREAGYGFVLYALKRIPEGTRVDAFCIASSELKLSRIPKDAVSSYRRIFGRTAKVTISQGEIITKSNLVEVNH